MSLRELIEGVEAHEKTLTVFDPASGTVEALRAHFEDRNLAVEVATSDAGPDGYAVLGAGDEFVSAVAVADLLNPAGTGDPYRPILDHLDETMFTSYDRDRMLGASREIEDRAWRVGDGTLHAGFQYPSNVEPQRDAYERMGAEEGLDVHVYVAPNEPIDPLSEVTLHVEDCAEIQRSWFVVYDGGGLDEYACALVAEEREGREGFYGFWTYDPVTVEYALGHLEATYAAEDGEPTRTGA